MERNAGFYAAFKDFLQSSTPKSLPVTPKKNVSSGVKVNDDKNDSTEGTTSDNSPEKCSEDFDINGTCNTEPASPSDSVYDSDYSNSGFPLPVDSSKANKNECIDGTLTDVKECAPKESSLNSSNAGNSNGIGQSAEENVMKGAIYINGDIEHNSSVLSALASVVQEFEISSSNDDSCESNSYEAIFVPLKNIAPYPGSTPPTSFSMKDGHKHGGLSNGCETKANKFPVDCNKQSCKEESKLCNISSGTGEVTKKGDGSLGSSSNKENYHCNMQSILSPPASSEDEPKVVVEITPACDICLDDISALKNIDGDSERELCCKEDALGMADGHSHHNSDGTDCENDCNICETWEKEAFNDSELSGGCSSRNSLDFLRKNHTHDLNIIVEKGSGEQLENIPRIASEVMEAEHEIIHMFHNILFDVTGCCKNKASRAITKQNILKFSGFPFDENSEKFEMKKICVSRMPLQILSDICYILLGMQTGNKTEMVDKILHFLLKPHNNIDSDGEFRKKINKKYNIPALDKDEQELLYEQAQRCRVVLKRLDDEEIQQKTNQPYKGKLSVSSNNSNKKPPVEYVKPAFIKIGPGQPLKSFPEVVKTINSASERVVHLFHVVMYGNADEFEKSKKNILEFSGFPPCQHDWSERRSRFMHMLTPIDLRHMCRALNLAQKDRSKSVMVSCLLEFLQKPSSHLMKRNLVNQQTPPPQPATVEECSLGKPLQSFEKIHSNIECATPEDLQELHDVIFSQPCESYQIHKKILEFSGFPFRENSPEFQARKTLMYYMSFSSIKKIASLLDLPCLGVLHCYRQDLTDIILKFLLKPNIYTKDFSPNPSLSRSVERSNEHSDLVNQGTQPIEERDSEFTSFRPPSASSFHSPQETGKRPSVHDGHGNTCSALVPTTNMSISHQFPPRKRCKSELSSSSEEEFEHTLPLAAFISHPSDSDLKQVINEIIEGNVQSITMSGLVQAVFDKYPEFDLRYRSHFIKKTARKILSRMASHNHDPAIASSQTSRPAAISFTYNGQISYHNHGRFSSVSSVVKAGNSFHNSSDCVVSTTVINERMPPALESNDETYVGSNFRNYPQNPCITYPS